MIENSKIKSSNRIYAFFSVTGYKKVYSIECFLFTLDHSFILKINGPFPKTFHEKNLSENILFMFVVS